MSTSQTLLLHAFPLASEMWASQRAALLAAGHTVLAPDLPGFGGMPGGIEGFPALATELLSTLPAGPLNVVGLSMGGYLALELLRQESERFARAVLADTSARADSPEKKREREEQAQRVLTEGAGFMLEAAREEHPAHTYRVIAPLIEAASPQGIAAALRAMAARQDSLDVLTSLPGKVAVLAIVGSQDKTTPPEVVSEIAGLSQGRLEMIEGAGHLSNLDQEKDFNALLLDFLA